LLLGHLKVITGVDIKCGFAFYKKYKHYEAQNLYLTG